MHFIIRKILIITFFQVFISLSSIAQLDDFEWLGGAWEMKGKNSITIEHWKIITPHTIEGSSVTRRIEKDNVVFSESLRILNMGIADYYMAKVPENEFPVPFKITYKDTNSFTAENPFHDFPQRIEYYRTSPDSLIVKISKIGEPSSVRIFSYKKNTSYGKPNK